MFGATMSHLLLAGALVLALLLVALGVWAARKGPKFRFTPRDFRRVAIGGAVVVGALLFLEVRSLGDPLPDVDGRDEITTVERSDAVEGSAPDRLQVVAAFFESGAVEDPVALDEVVLPFRAEPSEHRFTGLDLRVGATGHPSNWQERGRFWARLSAMPRLDHYMALPNLLGVSPIDGTGERPLLDTDIDIEFRTGLALHAPRDHVVTFLIRPLYPGDELGATPARAVASAIGAALRRGALDLPIQHELRERRTHPFANLVLEVDDLGGLVLFFALLFLVGSLRFWPAVAGVLFGGVAVLSLAARLDVNAAKSRLESPDPVARIAAAGRLAGQAAFASDAASAIDRAYDDEADPEVRLALVRALGIEPLTMGRTTDAHLTVDRARADADPHVRAAAEAVARAFDEARAKNEEERR